MLAYCDAFCGLTLRLAGPSRLRKKVRLVGGVDAHTVIHLVEAVPSESDRPPSGGPVGMLVWDWHGRQREHGG